MKSTQRALRRHHRARMLRRTMNLLVMSPETDPAEKRKRALFWYKNRQKCSCYMCGNGRKWWGPPIQHRRALLKAEADQEEFFRDPE
jgi:hypothetical protein